MASRKVRQGFQRCAPGFPALEDTVQSDRVLLPVENNGPLCATEEGQSRRGRVQVEAGLRAGIVRISIQSFIILLNSYFSKFSQF